MVLKKVMKMKLKFLLGLVILLILVNFVEADGGSGSSSGTARFLNIELTEQEQEYVVPPVVLRFEFNNGFYSMGLRIFPEAVWEIPGPYVKFIVNTLELDEFGNITSSFKSDDFNLRLGENKEIDLNGDGIKDIFLELKEIFPLDTTYANITITLKKLIPFFCGDSICSENENCNEDNCCEGKTTDLTTNDNCGNCGAVCKVDEKCYLGQCQTYCSNGVCETGETCVRDNCCNGIVTDFTLDNNCGSCGNTCNPDENCLREVCKTYCGNHVCEEQEQGRCKLDCQWCGDEVCNAGETYTTCSLDCESPFVCGDGFCEKDEVCCSDCGCKEGRECLENLCVPILKERTFFQIVIDWFKYFLGWGIREQ